MLPPSLLSATRLQKELESVTVPLVLTVRSPLSCTCLGVSVSPVIENLPGPTIEAINPPEKKDRPPGAIPDGRRFDLLEDHPAGSGIADESDRGVAIIENEGAEPVDQGRRAGLGDDVNGDRLTQTAD